MSLIKQWDIFVDFQNFFWTKPYFSWTVSIVWNKVILTPTMSWFKLSSEVIYLRWYPSTNHDALLDKRAKYLRSHYFEIPQLILNKGNCSKLSSKAILIYYRTFLKRGRLWTPKLVNWLIWIRWHSSSYFRSYW